jgi:flagellar motor switch protein FliN
MPRINESVKKFLDAVTGGLTDVNWVPRGAELPDLEWRSCALTIDPACRFYGGATPETWEQFGFNTLADAVKRAAAGRFGSRVGCTEEELADRPPAGGVEVVLETGSGASIEFVLSPELADALGAESQAVRTAEPAAKTGVDMLMHVEIPVSVSLGRTRMRMKDLLVLSQGSVVELDQEPGDNVEIRVNNCVIARGEVVAVDGNYGVRIVEMVSDGMAARALT